MFGNNVPQTGEIKGCTHGSQQADLYGISCRDCGKQIAGYGYAYGTDFNTNTQCVHRWTGETQQCKYCHAAKPTTRSAEREAEGFYNKKAVYRNLIMTLEASKTKLQRVYDPYQDNRHNPKMQRLGRLLRMIEISLKDCYSEPQSKLN